MTKIPPAGRRSSGVAAALVAATGKAVTVRGWLPLLLALWLAVGTAGAQPYVAGGGFGRPFLVAGPGIVPAVGVAADAERTVVVWADSEGVWLRELADGGAENGPADARDDDGPAAEGEPVNVLGPGSIRQVTAAMAGGEPAIAWLQRDLRTGNTLHSLTWKGRDYLLFEAGQETQLQVGSGAGRPWVLAARRFDGQAHLQLFTFDEEHELREPRTLHSTTLSVRGATAMPAHGSDEALPRWLGWLQGESTSGPFGLDAEWSAYAVPLSDDGEPMGAPLELGMADVTDERQTVVLGMAGDASPAGSARALWLGVDGNLQLTTISSGTNGARITSTADLAEAGRPVAVLPGYAYWHSDNFVRRTALGPLADEATSVAWSPVIIAGVELAIGGDPLDPQSTTIAWHGRRQGGASEAYVSNDFVGFTPNLSDRIAALMGWSPWSLWQQAAGQVLTSLLVGIIAVMVLAPVLFALSLLAVRVPGLSRTPTVGGVVLGVLVPLAIAVFIAVRFPQSALAQLDQRGLLVAAAALVIGAAAAYLINRRADREAQMGLLVTSVTVALVAISLWAFLEYPSWAPAVGLG